APEASRSRVLGTPQAAARSLAMAAFALPSSGAARTATHSASDPSASGFSPSTASRRAPGRAWIRMARPPAAGRKGSRLELDVGDNQVTDEPQQQDQDQRRQIDPAHQGHDPADRPQQGFGQGIAEAADAAHDGVVAVDDAEAHQPG